MIAGSHNDAVERQFGPQANAYVASAAHSKGPDLERLSRIAQGHPLARVLDLGCGGGHASYCVAPHVGHVVACDLSGDMLDAVAQEASGRNLSNISVSKAAAEQLPFADGAFDLLVCRLSAHHWGDLGAGLREARRVLRPGGSAIMIDVVAPGDPACDTHLQAIELLRDPSHVRDYRIDEWSEALQHAGFEIRAVAMHELPMEFRSWVERMRTPSHHVNAILSLQGMASANVRRALDIRDDGSFTIRVAIFELEIPAMSVIARQV